MKTTFKPSRRSFLKASAVSGGGLVIGFVLPAAGRLAEAATQFKPNAFLRVASNGRVTVVCGLSEMGQGVLTAIPMLVAEELDADWTKVSVEQAPADKAYANPMFGIQATGGSTSVRGHWEPMRKAGAAAREMLVAAAAAAWKAKPEDCRTHKGVVIHKRGRRLSYGRLVARASKLSVPAEPKLKDPRDFIILGRDLKRLDTPPKVNGSAKFGLDVRLRGMLTAVLTRPPVLGGKTLSFDDSKARAIPGVKQVLQTPHGVAVLADGYWAAKKGRDVLEIKWDDGPNVGLSSDVVSRTLTDATTQEGKVARNDGDFAAAKPARTLDVIYEAPYLAHACMEPMNCTAWVKPGSVEIWAGTQAPGPTKAIVANVAGVDPGKVKVHTMYLGGGFGRRFAPDFTIDATILSKMSGQPVKLIYSREDDMRAYYYRPASVTRFTAGLDAGGNPVSFRARVASPSIMAASGSMKIPPSGIDKFALEGIEDLPYDIPNLRVEYSRQEPGVQVWFWRSVGHSQNIFFSESLIDEMAHAAGKDPFEYRRALLGKQPRYKGVLELAAAKAAWGSPLPAGVQRGIAVAQSFGSYVAEVAEVSVGDDGQVKLQRVVAAVDCGMTVNPEIIRRQIESAIVYGLTAALYGRITLKDGKVEQGNFDSYPVLRINEMPKVEVHIVPSVEKPGGIGEPGLPALAPAVTGAIFAATGKRVRSLPIDPDMLKKA
ncbi:MAG TPA: xanthine dehydrogenase family protein molybdopterin-binding subunit [Burkholderiales bacterium]|nr:xanthine dehydrogenase family protein molybdopterin-binding subunit [Burkholderiales bacterium]